METRLDDPRKLPIRGAVRVLEVFSNSAQIAFDRMLANRLLGESVRAIVGEDAQTWSRRLVETGESLNLRVRFMEATLSEALTFVRQGIPIAFCVDRADGSVDWTVITDARGRKVRLAALEDKGPESWISIRRLRRQLQLGLRANDKATLVIGQPALACQAPGRSPSHQSNDHPLSPMARLIGLVRPEKKDLWVVLVFSLFVGVLTLATPIAVEALVNTVAFGRFLQPIVILAVVLFTFLAFAAAMRGLLTYIVEILQRRLFVRVVEDLAYRLPRVRLQEFDRQHGPELVNRFFEVVTVQKAAAALLLDGAAIVLQTIIGMAVLAFYHPFLLGFDAVLLLLICFVVFVLGRGAVRTATKESKAKYAVGAWLEELARHTAAFKLHSGIQFALERADQLTVDWLDARRSHFRVVIRQILFALGLQAFAATALLGLGGWLVIMGELTLGQLVAAELIVMVIVGSFAKLGKHMESLYDLLASMDKLGMLFDLSTETHDKLFHLRDATPARVQVRDVSYAYAGTPVLRNVSLDIPCGVSLALTGTAGAGKSTLIDLLAGLRLPAAGHIELDGIDLREIRPDSLREHLSLARSIDIFAGTINENVHLNRSNVRTNDVRDALETVGLLDEVLQLPDGLNTVVQTNGAPLTSTQAVRLMLARAIVGRPRLLIIDGLIDRLPDNIASELMTRLTRESTAWTLLIATGRSSVIESCSSVFTLRDVLVPSLSLAPSGSAPGVTI